MPPIPCDGASDSTWLLLMLIAAADESAQRRTALLVPSSRAAVVVQRHADQADRPRRIQREAVSEGPPA